jgi:hypothetical protein
MTDEEREALEQVQFNWAVAAEDVWSPVPHHVEELHTLQARTLVKAVPRATGAARNPIGIVLQGQAGVGKTHLLRWLRQQVEPLPGYFFLIRLVEGQEFWRSAVHGVVTGLANSPVDQLKTLLNDLCLQAELEVEQQQRILGTIPVRRDDLDALVDGLRAVDRSLVAESHNTLRALVLLRARSSAVSQIGEDYLNNDGDALAEHRGTWGFRGPARPRTLVLEDLSRLLAATGPTVLAVDQIDTLIVHSATALKDLHERAGDPTSRLGEVANGLMELREHTSRTITVVACLPGNWDLITGSALHSAADRFQVVDLQSAMPDASVAERIVGQQLQTLYAEVGHRPPYPTWPVLSSAFAGETARNSTPRNLMKLVARHIRACLDADAVVELADFTASAPLPPGPTIPPSDVLAALDERFAELRKVVDTTAPLDVDTEDRIMPALLDAGLRAWIIEQGEAGQRFTVDRVPGRRPAVHARLRQVLNDDVEDEVHYAFRGIAHHNARAVQTRITTARTDTGLVAGADRRRVVLLRNRDWPTGPKTAETVTAFRRDGGVDVPLGESDIRTFAALAQMQRPQPRGWVEWLVSRRPAGSTELLGRVLPQHSANSSEVSEPMPVRPTPAYADEQQKRTDDPGSISEPELPGVPDGGGEPNVPVGRSQADGSDVLVPLESLRKHTAVFAGSGSGKTVLLRRLIEECALKGVSAIVLDPNNDLARLGDAWPEPPKGWWPGDQDKAAEYIANVDVVVWTPGRERGRPLAFRPLPDFSAVIDDDDEFQQALDSAVASLAPRLQLTGRRLEQGKAVLREALEHFASGGGSSLPGLVDLLAELPDNVSTLRPGPRLAADIADALQAAMINDRLFAGSAEAVDPSTLLTPAPGKRARVSVVNFVGLPTDAQRQGFVNQLQMALFSWVKANPAGDRPLGGLLVMDEAQTFVPSSGRTVCTASTIALASQARKYGLGLVFATQAPKGLHNQITGNAATQFFGYLNAGAQIAAATELASRKGGRVDDISRLGLGEFYVAGVGTSFRKVREPMCLSHHPASPPTAEEVIERAARRDGDLPPDERSST